MRSPETEARAVAGAGVGESVYLTRQAQLAKQAMRQTVADMGSLAAQGADPRQWMQQCPWATLGASAVAGFAATVLLVPSKEQQALKKLAAIERALQPPPPPKAKVKVESDGEPESGEAGYKTGRQSFTRALLGELIGAMKPAVISLLTAGVTATASKPTQSEMQAAAAAGEANAANAGA